MDIQIKVCRAYVLEREAAGNKLDVFIQGSVRGFEKLFLKLYR